MAIKQPETESLFIRDFKEWLSGTDRPFTSETAAGYPVFTISGDPGIRVCCIALTAWNGSHPLPAHGNPPGSHPPLVLWEDIWFRKNALVKSTLLARLGESHRIPARITQVEKIDKPAADDFLNAHHLNGACAARYRFGLFVPKKHFRFLPPHLSAPGSDRILVAVAAFAAPKTFTKGERPYKSGELIRIAGLRGTTVVGGLSKLIGQFVKAYPVDDIMTYVDREWSSGEGFSKIGFSLVSESPPINFVIDQRNYARYALHRLDNKILLEGRENLIHIANAGNLKLVRKFDRPETPAPVKPLLAGSPPYDIIFVVGPTASGKTSLAVRLAYELGGEIISLDSRQVYRRMDIGTGKDLSEYRVNGSDIPYHLIDLLEPGTPYSVYEFQKDFARAYDLLRKKNKIAIACGGSGLYIESALNHLRGLPGEKAPSVLVIGLNPSAALRRLKIEKRLTQRIEQGLIQEVQHLLDEGLPAETLIRYGLEYKYVTEFLIERITYSEMREKLEVEIIRFSKRQVTFLKKIERAGYRIQWLPPVLQ